MQSIFTLNRTALVTGASAGIGLELTRALAPKLESLIVVARRLERLEELAKELRSRFPGLNLAIEAADLSVSEAVQTLLRQLEARGLEIDVLVNNAGLSESELFERFRRGAELIRPSKPGPGESEFDQVAGTEGGATPG